MFRAKAHPDGDGEPYELLAEARDVLMWERAGRDRAFGDITERLRMTDVYSLMHLVAKRTGRYDGPLEMFEADVSLELMPPTDDDEAPDPTPKGR